MSNTESGPHLLTTGGDPRLHPEYIKLKNEIQKLSHPARPDVNWQQVMDGCITLFEQNGADLQSVCWFTLALAYLYGPKGLRDGLKVTVALTGTRWQTLWPPQPADRAAILKMSFQRLHTLFRSWPAGEEGHRHILYECEKYLALTEQALTRAGLKAGSGISAFSRQVRAAAEQQERSEKAEPEESGRQTAHHAAPCGSPPAKAKPPVFIIQHEKKNSHPRPASTVRPFFAGMVVMLVVFIVAATGWHFGTRTDDTTRTLSAAVPPLARLLTEAERGRIRQDTRIDVSAWIHDVRKQTEALDTSGIGRAGSYSADLALLAAGLWPFEDVTDRLLSEVIARREAAAATPDEEGAWQQGMEHLTQLSEKLNAIDEKRGRYMTVSELKSAVFSSRQAFSLHIPAEEWLRRYEVSESSSGEAQFQRALDELQARYDLIRIRRVLNDQRH